MSDNHPTMRGAVAMACECEGQGHQPGCTLHLWLIIKYGDERNGIKGVVAVRGGKHFNTPEDLEIMDQAFDRLAPMWVEKKRSALDRKEATWMD